MVGPWLIGTAKPYFWLTFSVGRTGKVLRTSLDPMMFCSFIDAEHEFSKHLINLWLILLLYIQTLSSVFWNQTLTRQMLHSMIFRRFYPSFLIEKNIYMGVSF